MHFKDKSTFIFHVFFPFSDASFPPECVCCSVSAVPPVEPDWCPATASTTSTAQSSASTTDLALPCSAATCLRCRATLCWQTRRWIKGLADMTLRNHLHLEQSLWVSTALVIRKTCCCWNSCHSRTFVWRKQCGKECKKKNLNTTSVIFTAESKIFFISARMRRSP